MDGWKSGWMMDVWSIWPLLKLPVTLIYNNIQQTVNWCQEAVTWSSVMTVHWIFCGPIMVRAWRPYSLISCVRPLVTHYMVTTNVQWASIWPSEISMYGFPWDKMMSIGYWNAACLITLCFEYWPLLDQLCQRLQASIPKQTCTSSHNVKKSV